MNKLAKTYQEVSALADKVTRDVTSSPYAWMGYLDTASRMYKYSFQEQLLIHEQKPESTACASFALWNSRFNRVVKRGTQGIALIDQTSQRPKLKYVFDVSDTVKRIGGKNPYLWKIPAVAEHFVVERLAQRFDLQPENLILDEFLHELTMQSVDDETEEVLENLKERLTGSLLEELDEDNLRVRFATLAAFSLEYMLLNRCGIYPGDYLEPEDFRYITDFNNTQVLSVLGDALAQNANELLTAIGQVSKQMQEELRQNREAFVSQAIPEMAEKKEEAPLDNGVNSGYNALKRESGQYMDSNQQGGQEHEDDISRGSRRPDVSRPDHSGSGHREDAGQVRSDAPGLPERQKIVPLSGDAPENDPVGAPVGDRGPGRGDGRTPDGTDGGAGGRD